MRESELKLIRATGNRISGRFFVGYYLDCKKNDLAVVVSKKHGSAVERNRIKRRMREAFRIVAQKAKKNIMAVFYPKFTIKTANFEDLCTTLFVALERS